MLSRENCWEFCSNSAKWSPTTIRHRRDIIVWKKIMKCKNVLINVTKDVE